MVDMDRINKLKRLRALFLALGIALIVAGVVIAFTYGFVYGYTSVANGETPVVDFTNPTYILVSLISSAMINGGIVLLILRAALLGARLRSEIRRSSTYSSTHIDTY